MGSEANCRVRYDGQASTGKALLETAELIFRGDFRLRIPFASITTLSATEGELEVRFDGHVAVFELGRNAEKWAAKMRNPRGLMEKLGVKAGQRVSVLGVNDQGFLTDLRERAGEVGEGQLLPECDWIFYEADEPEDLVRLEELRYSLTPNGGVWVVSPKGKAARIKDVQVMAAAREAGLVDNKVVSFSPTHTALKLVIPVTLRRDGKPLVSGS